MPIEDVNYLMEHSVKDAFMFFVDSDSRDRAFCPSASKYIVQFEEPIKLVYGMDILDGAIPNTMYNIDAHNSQISVMSMQYSEVGPPVDALDAKMMSMLTEQQENAHFVQDFNSLKNFEAFVVDVQDWDSRPELLDFIAAPIVDGIPVSDIDSFFIVVARFDGANLTPLAGIAAGGQGNFLNDPALMTFVSMNSIYIIPITDPAALYLSKLRTAPDAISVLNMPNAGWEVTISYNVLVPSDHGGAAFVVRELTETLPYYWLQQKIIDLEIGTYDINQLQAEIQFLLTSLDMYVVGTDRTGSTDLTKQGRVMFTHHNWPFVLNMDHSSIYQNLGFDSYAVPGTADYRQGILAGNHRLFGSIYNGVTKQFQLKAPGTVSLLGTRYITLRCPEIEEHLSASVTYNNHAAGIGVFKLQDINDVTNLRFDFATFLRKPFHPIGKLSRLTFEFQTPWGGNYDFKGYNHHILISIKYYAPDMSRTFAQSSLNPNYDPDYIRYVSKLAHYAQIDDYVEDEDDDEDDDGDGEDEDEDEV